MTAGDIGVLRIIADILSIVGTWPIAIVLLLVVIGPWVALLYIGSKIGTQIENQNIKIAVAIGEKLESIVKLQGEKISAIIGNFDKDFDEALNGQEKRFEKVVLMYESNVLLVKGYEKLSADLTSIIHINTQAMTKLVDRIDGRQYCPFKDIKGIDKWQLTPKE